MCDETKIGDLPV
jgi:hypothetical protein